MAILKQRNADAIEKIVTLQDEANADTEADVVTNDSEELAATQEQLQDASRVF